MNKLLLKNKKARRSFYGGLFNYLCSPNSYAAVNVVASFRSSFTLGPMVEVRNAERM